MASVQATICQDQKECHKLFGPERFNNALILIPFFVSPMKVVCESLLLWCKPEFDFERTMLTYLKIFFVFALFEAILRQSTILIANLFDDVRTFTLILEAVWLSSIMLMVLSHNFMHLKLGMFVQMMPCKYRWQTMQAQGSACVFASLVYALAIGLRVLFLNIITRHNMLIIINCSITMLTIVAFYTFYYIKSRNSMRMVASSPITLTNI